MLWEVEDGVMDEVIFVGSMQGPQEAIAQRTTMSGDALTVMCPRSISPHPRHSRTAFATTGASHVAVRI